MNEDTRKLLGECTSGCKMAINSMKQVEAFIKDEKFLDILTSYTEKHEEIENSAANLLAELGKPEKEPSVMSSTMSWVMTGMKMLKEADTHQAAKLMMDGCNMGIQSISEGQNKCPEASTEASDLARELVKIEEDFMEEMKKFL